MELFQLGQGSFDLPTECIWKYLCIACRLIPILIFVPAFGGQTVPFRFKLTIAIVLSVAIAPMVPSVSIVSYRSPWSLNSGVLAIEFFIGFMFSILMGLIFHIAVSGGEIIDTLRGQTLAQVLVPQMPAQASQLGQFFLQLSVVVFFAIEGHHLLIDTFISSFADLSVKDLASSATNSGKFFGIFLLFFQLMAILVKNSILMISPIIVLLIVMDVLLGIVNRIVPAMQVFQLGLPVKMWAALLLVLLSISLIAENLVRLVQEFVALRF